MHFGCRCTLLTAVLVASCVARDESIIRPAFPATNQEHWNVAVDEALHRRATRDDFNKPPLALPPWAQDPIPLHHALVDPANGRKLQELRMPEGYPELFKVPTDREVSRHWLAPFNPHTGQLVAQPSVRAEVAGDDGIRIRFQDEHSGANWISPILWPRSATAFTQTTQLDCAILARQGAQLAALSWHDGRVLWTRNDCPRELTIEGACALCSNLRYSTLQLDVIELDTGRNVFSGSFPAMHAASIYPKLRLLAVAEDQWDWRGKAIMYDFDGRQLCTVAGSVAAVAASGGLLVLATGTGIYAFEGGRQLWHVPFSAPRSGMGAEIDFTSRGDIQFHCYPLRSSGDGWTALLDSSSGVLLWTHETPGLVPAVEEYERYSYLERRGAYLYVINQEGGGSSVEVLDPDSGELLRIWAYDLERDRQP